MSAQGWTCTSCGATNLPSARLCGKCGAPQGDSAASTQAATPTPAAAQQPGSPPQTTPGQQPPGPPRGRPPRWAWLALGGATLATIVIVVVVMMSGGSDEPEATDVTAKLPPVPTASPGDPASAQFDALVARLPEGIANCQPFTPYGDSAGAVAGALCGVTAHPDWQVYFELFSTPEEAVASYDRFVQSAQFVPDTGNCAAEGGEHAWTGAAGTGRAMCGANDTSGAVRWRTDGSPIVGYMLAPGDITVTPTVYAFLLQLPPYGAG